MSLLKKYNIMNPLLWLGLFSLLYSIWLVPGALGIRYACLVLGSFLGIYQVIKNNKIIRFLDYWNILLIYALFLIVISHYYLNSDGGWLIKTEFSVIWKKTFLGVNFAIGLGLLLRSEISLRYKNIFIFGLFLPVALFCLLYLINSMGSAANIDKIIIANYFDYWKDNYISKYQYVFFAMPILGVCFYEFKTTLVGHIKITTSLVVLLILITILSSFYLINGKNGILYFVSCFILFVIGMVRKSYNSIGILLLISLLSISVTFVARQHFITNSTWQNLESDIPIAFDTDKYSNWKNSQPLSILNEKGNVVSETTYLRIAWLKEGILLVSKYPLGYGLIQDSFKYLGEKEWQNSSLSHTHWGWLDLTLGLGIPGLIITVLAVYIAFNKCRKSKNYYAKTGVWVLPLLSFAFLTSEVCEKTSWDMFLFMIAFYSVVSIEDA